MMRSPWTILGCLGTAWCAISAATLEPPPGLARMPITHNQGFHFVSVSVGNPPQEQSCIVDMAASDSYFLSHNLQSCGTQTTTLNGTQQSFCRSTFDANASTSFFAYPPQFPILENFQYNVTGVFGADDVTIEMDMYGTSGASLRNMTFGLIERAGSSLDSCVLGLGLQAGELTVTTLENGAASPVYDNFPILMKKSGLINKVSYSVYMNQSIGDEGVIIFGGVDHTKYHGNLTIIPLVDYATDASLGRQLVGEPTDFQVVLSGLSVSVNGTVTPVVENARVPVDLAAGSPLTTLPSGIASQMAHLLGLDLDEGGQIFWMPCGRTANVHFNLSGAEIVVPLSEFTIETGLHMRDGSPACAVLISAQDDPLWSIGDAFFRAAYVHADLETFEIAVAQAAYGNWDIVDYEVDVPGRNITNSTRAPNWSDDQLSNEFNISAANYTLYPVIYISGAALRQPSLVLLAVGLIFTLAL